MQPKTINSFKENIMNKFEDRFLQTLDEDIFGGRSPKELQRSDGRSPKELQRSDDTEAYEDSFENAEDMENFNTLAPEGYAERHIEQVKGWQSKISDFLDWLNGTGASLRTELSELDDQYEGVSKDAEKKIADVAQNLGALKEILVEIPREIKIKTRDQASEQQAEAPVQTQY
jgi:hypothetical protein